MTEPTPSPCRARPPSTPRQGLEKLATYPYRDPHLRRRRRLPGQRRRRRRPSTRPPAPATFAAPAGLSVPADADVSLTGSHIRPQPGYGYDERRHVTVWGRRGAADGDRFTLARRAGLGLGRGRGPVLRVLRALDRPVAAYFDALSAERGTPVKPRLSFGWLALRTTRLPFLTATIVPVVLGHRDRRPPGLVRPADRRPDGHRRGVRPARAERRERRLRHRPGRRRRQRHADPVQRRLARHPVRPRVVPPDGRPRDDLLRRSPALIGLVLLALRGSPALLAIGVVGFIVLDRLHRAAAEVRLSRPRRDRGRDRVRAADAARRLRRPDRAAP